MYCGVGWAGGGGLRIGKWECKGGIGCYLKCILNLGMATLA